MKYNVCLFSKPIQVVNYLNYKQDEANLDRTLFFLKNVGFSGGDIVAERLEKIFSNNTEIIKVSDYYLSLKYAFTKKIKTLYIDSDVGIKLRFLIFLLSPEKTVLIEEGIGLYREIDVGRYRSKTYIGEYYKTNVIATYNPDKMPVKTRPKASRISTSIMSFVQKNTELMNELFINEKHDPRLDLLSGNIAVYITDWYFNVEKIPSGKIENRTLLVKPHPGIKDVVPEQYILLNRYLIGELDLIWLADRFKDQIIDVYHHNSTT